MHQNLAKILWQFHNGKISLIVLVPGSHILKQDSQTTQLISQTQQLIFKGNF